MKSEVEEISDDDQEMFFGGDTTCSVCYGEFLDAADLEIHIRQMHSTPVNPKYCQFCPETYTDLLDYAAHVRDYHLDAMRCCRYCTKVFLDGGKLKMHERRHLNADTYSCSQCDSVFREMVLVELHERKNHDNTIDGCFLKCMPCLSSVLNLDAKFLLQTVGKKKFSCRSCTFTSICLQTYIQHLDEKNCKGYVCDRCSKLYKSRKYIIKHVRFAKRCMIIKDNSENATEVCKDCKSEVHAQGMKSHAKICNALRCIHCNKVCSNIDELSMHQLEEHPFDMTLIRCTFCLKEFIGQRPLQKHIARVHKPNFHLFKYKCIECNIIFQHPHKLFVHYFMKHKELEPFTCKICNKKFRVRKAFSLHIKLDHKSVGFVEFDDQYHVFFTANKSERQFIPRCVVPQELMEAGGAVDDNQKPFSIRDQKLETDDEGTYIRSQDLLETDADATEAETEDNKKLLKRKQIPKQIKSKRPKRTVKKEPVLIYSSDEEPLLVVRKRAQKKRGNNRRLWNWKKNMVKAQFTCKICNKNCYTYQNHQNHMSLHNKDQEIECVKCLEKFNSKNDLSKHMSMEHSTSRLTETLKNLLQKKKHDSGSEPAPPHAINTPKKAEKFKISMKKVKADKCGVAAIITPVEKDLSVKNFLENFTPDVSDATPKAKVEIASQISITPYLSPYYRESTIKLTKFKDEPMNKPVSLKMPERFKQHDHYTKTKISIKIVEQPPKNDFIVPDYEHNYFDSFQDQDDDRNDIPEVAHEVSLEGTEEPSEQVTKIVIPKMPKGYSKIHVATLQTEAPYFKIIKVDSEDLTELETVKNEEQEPARDFIDLPGGTKLVTANPLAHLLGNKPLEKIVPAKNRYKPVIKDFQGMLAQAMLKLERPPAPRKSRARQAKKVNDTE